MISNFTVPTISITGTITLIQEDTTIELNPQDSITPIEVLRISIMLSYAVSAYRSYQQMDWLEYIKEYKLEEHFKITEEKK